MRLINAEVLLKFTKLIMSMENRCSFETFQYAVEHAPTIEAEPVRHARLLLTDAYPHRVYCGWCTQTLIPNEEYCFEKNRYPSYCMWCGAKLDKLDEVSD